MAKPSQLRHLTGYELGLSASMVWAGSDRQADLKIPGVDVVALCDVDQNLLDK